MDEKIIIKSKLKNLLPPVIAIGAIGPIIFLFFAYISITGEKSFERGLEYTFGGGNGAMLIVELLAVLTIILAVFLYFRWSKVEMTVTDKRVYGRDSGGKRVDLPLDSISAVAGYKKNAVAVTTASGAIKFGYLANADEILNAVSKLLINRQDKNATQATIKQEVPQSTADELKKYKDLLDSGTITQEEFDAKKKQLLGL